MRTHSFLSPKCEIRTSIVGGKGVFAKKAIKKGEMVAVWGGIVYTSKEVTNLSKKTPHYLTHTVSVHDGFYLGPINPEIFDDTEFFNHSCDPNIGIKGQITVIARRDICKNEELYFDYDTTETTNDGWFMCKCDSKKCRKKIDGSAWKNKKFVKENWDYLSWYVKEKIKKNTSKP